MRKPASTGISLENLGKKDILNEAYCSLMISNVLLL
jgi:hypothetical protein